MTEKIKAALEKTRDTIVYKSDWDKLRSKLQSLGGEYIQFLEEMSAWVGNGFEEHKSFTMLGN